MNIYLNNKKKFLLISLFVYLLILIGCLKAKKSPFDISSSPITTAISFVLSANSTASSSVTSVPTYTLGGTISGLTATGLVLASGTTPTQSLSINSGSTSFQFSNPISEGSSYNVSVTTQPSGLFCTVTNATGTIKANVNNISITCIVPAANWTAQTILSASWTSVTYGNGLFVAVASGPSTVAAGPSTIAASSPDGINWTARTLPTSTFWSSVTYGNGTFVAVAQPSPNAASSTDGINWTARTLASPRGDAVTFGNGIFVSLSAGSTLASTSSDGITWTGRTLPISASWSGITFGKNIFVGIAFGSANIVTSSDGINWATRTLPNSAQWFSVTSGNGTYVAIGTTPNSVAISQ